jgi:hypothetical protein
VNQGVNPGRFDSRMGVFGDGAVIVSNVVQDGKPGEGNDECENTHPPSSGALRVFHCLSVAILTAVSRNVSDPGRIPWSQPSVPL